MSAPSAAPASSTPSHTSEGLLTAEEFMAKYGHLKGVELVRGRVVWPGQPSPPTEHRMPKFRHGVVSYRAVRVLSDFIEANRLGWVAINDTFVRTEADPSTVRGADVLFVSYTRLPAGEPPEDLSIPPDLVVEVRSPTDRWTKVFVKLGEYLEAGVAAVLVLDPATRSASVYRPNEVQQIFEDGDDLVIPDVLPGFAVPVRRFFE